MTLWPARWELVCLSATALILIQYLIIFRIYHFDHCFIKDLVVVSYFQNAKQQTVAQLSNHYIKVWLGIKYCVYDSCFGNNFLVTHVCYGNLNSLFIRIFYIHYKVWTILLPFHQIFYIKVHLLVWMAELYLA